LQEFHTALSLDPLSPIMNMNYALTLLVARRSADAISHMQKLLERDPSFSPAHFYLSQIYVSNGRYAEAVGELRQSSLRGGWKAPASPDLQGYLKLMVDPDDPAPPTNIAVTYALAGDRNKAFEYLEKAYAVQDSEIGACIRFPAFDAVKSDPRWAAYMRRLGLPE